MIRYLGLAALCSGIVSAQVVQGTVYGSDGHGLAGATVTFESEASPISKTNSVGTYRLQAPHAGTYSLRANAPGYAAGTAGPITLGPNETRKIDLTLKPLEAEFSDEPNFIVAGVTDPSAHGGHGSDTLLRSTETLAKQTASLGNAAKEQYPLEAVQRYQRAAEQDPTEPHLFDWGSELLVHRATPQAIEVFTKGARLFPSSTRMLLGLAVSWYTNGSDDNASHYFFAACDLNPADPLPYLFLGRVRSDAITRSEIYLEKMARFARLNPGNAMAQYDYAASVWKQRTGPDDSEALAKVQALLHQAIQIDPHCDSAYLLLGIVYSELKDTTQAIDCLRKANTEEAHYRLAQEYRKTGEIQKADAELATYNQLSRESANQAQRERLEIQQFVFSLRGKQ